MPMPMPPQSPDYAAMLDDLANEYPELEKKVMDLQADVAELMSSDEESPEALPELSLGPDEEEEITF